MRTDAAERFGDERETFDFLVALIREGHVEPALLTEAHLARLEPAVERLVGRLEAADAALVRRMLGRVIAYRADAARLDAEHVLRRCGLSEAEAFRRVCAEDTPMTEVPEEEPAGAAPVRSLGPAVRVGYLGRVLLGVAFWVWLFGPTEAAAWLAAEVIVKFPSAGEKLLTERALDPVTHDRAIRKACESFRVTPQRKEALRALRCGCHKK